MRTDNSFARLGIAGIKASMVFLKVSLRHCSEIDGENGGNPLDNVGKEVNDVGINMVNVGKGDGNGVRRIYMNL